MDKTDSMSNLTVSYSPHIRSNASTQRIMLDVIIALTPAFIAAVWIFGWRAALVTGVCVLSCVLFEWAYQKILKRQNTVYDLSACITGILLAYNLPVTIPLWQAVVGSFVAIVLVKMLFGGLGKNFANPAATARIFMFLAFSAEMTTWVIPDGISGATPLDALTGATPLALFKNGELEYLPGIWDMLIGTRGGCLGETSTIALLIGGIYLVARRVITWHAPVSFIGTVFVLTALFGEMPVYNLFTGGLIIGAVFMVTDYATTPQTNTGRLIFGIGAGVFTVIIRLYGSYPEGVSFAILFMNILVPYINKITLKKALGAKKEGKKT